MSDASDNVIPFPTPEPEVDTTEGSPEAWYTEHANVVLTGRWMVADGWEGDEIVSLFERPWNYDDEFKHAAAWLVEQASADLAASMARHPAGSQLPT